MLVSAAFAEETTPKLELKTNAFLDQGALPVLYTCDGKNISPQLEWANVPDKTQAFALILADSDAPNGPFYHWVLFNIPKATTSLPQGIEQPPSNAMVGKNSLAKFHYNGPCPPKGSAHSYVFTLYALDASLKLSTGADAKTILEAMKNHIVEKAELTAVYSRWINA